jgi:hypothetical protein
MRKTEGKNNTEEGKEADDGDYDDDNRGEDIELEGKREK